MKKILPIFLVIFILLELTVVLWFLSTQQLPTPSPIPFATITPYMSPLPTSGNAIVDQFYSADDDQIVPIQIYEIHINNGAISTKSIVKDTNHEIYFINDDPSGEYNLTITQNSVTVESTTINPRQIFATLLPTIGTYTFKITNSIGTDLEGNIYVQ